MPPRSAFSAVLMPLFLQLIAGCGDGSDAPSHTPSPGSCAADSGGSGGLALAVGTHCLQGVTLRVQSEGTWHSAGPDDGIDVATTDGGVRLTLRSARAKVQAFEVRIPAVAGQSTLQQGYQSWGFSGAVKLPDAFPLDPAGAPVFKAAQSGDPVDEAAGVSYGSAVIGGGAGDTLVVGALSAERATTGVAARHADAGAEVSIVYGALGEILPADPDGKTRSEVIAVLSDKSAEAGLDRLAAEMGKALPAGSSPPKRPPGGWFSWNEHFENVDATLVQSHIDVVATKLAPVGMPLVEIDDGWERAWGDWRANDKFPGGMEAIGKAIQQKGLTPGIWMAPFLVDVASDTAKTVDPALLVHGKDGRPLVHRPGGHSKDYYVLDGTNPKSMAIVTDQVAALAAAGFRFFKFDFLYAGALVGARSQPGATGNQALRSGLALLRKAAGKDAILNACGAPILPVLGFADSLRVGSDTVYSLIPPNWYFVVSAARSLAARAYLHPLVWPDADQVQLRSPFSVDDARVGATVAAMSGPAYSFGDDLTTLDPARLAIGLDPQMLDLAGAAAPAAAQDLFESPAPAPVGNPVLDAFASKGGDSTSPPPTHFSAVGKSGAHYTITISWAAPHKVTVTKAP